MAAEDHDRNRSPQVNPAKVGHSLDDLARGLANGTVSRREALRWMGGVLLGGTLASIPGVALAKPKPGKCNKDSQCPSGERCVNGVCEAGVCPDLTCCCVCGHRLPDGSVDYGTCTDGTTFISDEGCRQYCIDTTPPGGALFSYSSGCTTPETYPGQRYMCAGSASTGFGCDLQAC
jgi:hypothetical protein